MSNFEDCTSLATVKVISGKKDYHVCIGQIQTHNPQVERQVIYMSNLVTTRSSVCKDSFNCYTYVVALRKKYICIAKLTKLQVTGSLEDFKAILSSTL